MLATQQMNSQGELLYVDNTGATTTEAEGNKPLRDLQLCADTEMVKQAVISRAKTQNPDWFHFPRIGMSLEDFLGMPNTQETGNLIQQAIARSLNRGDIANEIRSVRVVPINTKEVVVMIGLSRNPNLQLSFKINLQTGIEVIEE